jgi:hypothetical protein
MLQRRSLPARPPRRRLRSSVMSAPRGGSPRTESRRRRARRIGNGSSRAIDVKCARARPGTMRGRASPMRPDGARVARRRKAAAVNAIANFPCSGTVRRAGDTRHERATAPVQMVARATTCVSRYGPNPRARAPRAALSRTAVPTVVAGVTPRSHRGAERRGRCDARQAARGGSRAAWDAMSRALRRGPGSAGRGRT